MTEELKKRRGGRKRTGKKMSLTTKFISVNREHFSNGAKPDWRKIKMVR